MTVKIDDISLFKGFSAKELQSVKGFLKEKAFLKGESLFSDGALCERVFIIRDGRVKLFRTASSGREQILEVLSQGDTCACNPGSSEWSCSASAVALTPCKVWYLSRRDYVELVQKNSKVATSLNQLFAKRLQCMNALVEEVALKDAKKRLIKFLLDMHAEKKQTANNNGILFIPFTREEIAQRLGTARETIARYLSQLKAKKLINLKPFQIEILDKKGLEDQLS